MKNKFKKMEKVKWIEKKVQSSKTTNRKRPQN